MENNLKLQNINLKILKGELVFFIGRNNSGKSSLLKALVGGMYVIDEGKTELIING